MAMDARTEEDSSTIPTEFYGNLKECRHAVIGGHTWGIALADPLIQWSPVRPTPIPDTPAVKNRQQPTDRGIPRTPIEEGGATSPASGAMCNMECAISIDEGVRQGRSEEHTSEL